MQYNFKEFFETHHWSMVIEAVLLILVLAVIICFFVYKRNVRALFLLLLGGVLDVIVNVLAEIRHALYCRIRYSCGFRRVSKRFEKHLPESVKREKSRTSQQQRGTPCFHYGNTYRLSGYGEAGRRRDNNHRFVGRHSRQHTRYGHETRRCAVRAFA